MIVISISSSSTTSIVRGPLGVEVAPARQNLRPAWRGRRRGRAACPDPGVRQNALGPPKKGGLVNLRSLIVLDFLYINTCILVWDSGVLHLTTYL